MTQTVVSIGSEATLDEAETLLDRHGIRRLAVVDDGRLTGVLTLGDLRAVKATATAGTVDDMRQTQVATLMTPAPVTIPISATLGLAAQTMLQLKVSGLPVVDEEGELCGLLSESDLFRYIVENTD
jgi:acetoin utilization protein AcuB